MSIPKRRQGKSENIPNSDYGRSPQYIEVDGLYNISRSGDHVRGLDVIDSQTAERFYISDERDEKNERLIKQHLGQAAILQYVRTDSKSGISVYSVPRGTRLLTDVLKSPPYREAYMQHLKDKADLILERLRKIDGIGFGVELDHLALVPNDHAVYGDDEFLTIIPPVLDYTSPIEAVTQIGEGK